MAHPNYCDLCKQPWRLCKGHGRLRSAEELTVPDPPPCPQREPTDEDLERMARQDSEYREAHEGHELCGKCLSADRELEYHGDRCIVVCPCGRHSKVGYSPEEAWKDWDETNVAEIQRRADAAA